ncbi:TraR/DksA C4-type zinc finger protein [Clostridium sp. DJ247]|uniref:TraR/DksA C4-type zinc finger protein n=1 Tax=Clostridium sp. DJ247 TaxID=2726188 RepID=UPI00162417C5|nr:TraR/DksA C4-type zinc finger protein [Clostridium sp. DJ247]MBC2582948.1 yteA family sporulation protein [Clostridium sp. DJ247]
MSKEKLEYFRRKLKQERRRVSELINQMEENETINSNSAMSRELSFYDNHPADSATEIFDKERGMAFKENELSIIKKIDDALEGIDKGQYGKCKMCGSDIVEERLEFIPYAQFCVDCQSELNDSRPEERHNRPLEEYVIDYPFGYGHNDHDEDMEVEFDAEDSFQAVDRFNRLENQLEWYTDTDNSYVDPLERISNQQYRSQLPD